MYLGYLDDRKIAVELNFNGSERVVCGTGFYEPKFGPGPALRVEVSEPTGNYDLIFYEQQWTGDIAQDADFGCDYRICLTANQLCNAR
jgi:hypothetical protein